MSWTPIRTISTGPRKSRKWLVGEVITSLDQLVAVCEERRYVFTQPRTSPYHWSFPMSWPVRYVQGLIAQKRLLAGIRNPSYPWVWYATKKNPGKGYFMCCADIKDATAISVGSHQAALSVARVRTIQACGNPAPKIEMRYFHFDS